MKSLLLACLPALFATGALAVSNEIPFQPDLRGQTVQCGDFRHGADGGWTTLRAIPVQRQNEYTTVAADTTFHAGGPKTVGIDIGAVLNAVCPH